MTTKKSKIKTLRDAVLLLGYTVLAGLLLFQFFGFL